MYKFIKILALVAAAIATIDTSLIAVDRREHDDYDMYWRNREGQDWPPSDYPQNYPYQNYLVGENNTQPIESE